MFGLFKKKEPQPDYVDLVKLATPAEYKTAPFRMRKGEQYITSVNAGLFLYKSDGRIGGHGITGRIKIAKGIYYRAGAGRVATGKSWQQDQVGELHFTTERLIFNGSNKNMSVKWEKVIQLGANDDGTVITIDRESGPDWTFKLVEALPVEEFAAIDKAYIGLEEQ